MTNDNSHTSFFLYELQIRRRYFDVVYEANPQSDQHYSDGPLADDHDLLNDRLDRAFSYDNAGALKEAYSGSEARDYVNGTNSGTTTGPYRQSYQHDPFGHITSRTNRFWSQSDAFTASYANNRRQDPGFQYDAAGHLTQDADLQYAYDAAGLNVSVFSAAANKTIASGYDGDGQALRRMETASGVTSISYYVRSSVLGKVITELNSQGVKLKTNVYLGDQVLARQEPNWIVWQHDNPLTGSHGVSNRDGAYNTEIEPDPTGIDVGSSDPFIHPELSEPPPEGIAVLLAGPGIPNGRCILDGMSIDCERATEMRSSGVAVECPNNDCGPKQVYNPATEKIEWRFFQAFGDGYQGYLPLGATSNGDGGITLRNGDEGWGDLYKSTSGLFPHEFGQRPQITSDDHEFAHSRIPCPPTGNQLTKNPVIKKDLKKAFDLSEASGVERGGWIYWNQNTGAVFTIIKNPPTIDLLHPERSDSYLKVFLGRPPSPLKGWVIVGVFHTHPEPGGPDDWDIGLEFQRKVPGLIVDPVRTSANPWVYGPNRGIWFTDLPAGCH